MRRLISTLSLRRTPDSGRVILFGHSFDRSLALSARDVDVFGDRSEQPRHHGDRCEVDQYGEDAPPCRDRVRQGGGDRRDLRAGPEQGVTVCGDLSAWRAPLESIEHEGAGEDQDHRHQREDGHPRPGARSPIGIGAALRGDRVDGSWGEASGWGLRREPSYPRSDRVGDARRPASTLSVSSMTDPIPAGDAVTLLGAPSRPARSCPCSPSQQIFQGQGAKPTG